ncbi:MAG TPA: ABC transporter ATP-binding protein [Terriglobia bacterium]|nr:ABC transporter ATP-binding protein [Terriglobia bacterium]
MATTTTGPISEGTPQPSPATGLCVDSVIYRYPHFELGPVTFEAGAGELAAIIGPNGSGKSTLLEIASGYLKPLGGRVLLNGENLHALSPLDRARRVGLARQDTPLLFPFSVREFIRQGRHPHAGRRLFETGEDESWVGWAVEQTSMAHLAERRVTEISGGEFQRAVLARTLAQRPRLLLLDEPTANLDIGYQIEVLGLLRHLAAAEGLTVVIITHELNLASEMADRVLLLENGAEVRQGVPETVFDAALLSRVFQTRVAVDRNPSSGRPRVTWVTSPSPSTR